MGFHTDSAETFFHPETLRRLACDGEMMTVIEHANGNPLSIGRKVHEMGERIQRAEDGSIAITKMPRSERGYTGSDQRPPV